MNEQIKPLELERDKYSCSCEFRVTPPHWGGRPYPYQITLYGDGFEATTRLDAQDLTAIREWLEEAEAFEAEAYAERARKLGVAK